MIQTLEQRLIELRDLRRRVDEEIRSVKAAIADQKPRRHYRPRNVVPPCGTETAYQRHYTRGELADRECLDAHAAHERERAAERRRAARMGRAS